MPDISKITLPNNNSYDIKDGSAIANITRNGTTFTATKRDGTTFTFTQQNNDNIYTNVYCKTNASTAAKVGTLSNTSWASTTQPRLAMINFYYDNTAASALTLNVASHGAKPIYINGQPSSSTNYILPHGTYLGYFNGTNWYINTDGTIPQQTTDEVLVATNTTAATVNTKIWIEI